MQIIIEKLIAKNFKGIKNLEINFFNRTCIYGQNGSGKTSIADVVNWVLFGKDSSGSAKFDIRPQDENGKQIDFIEIYAYLSLLVDGKRLEIEKMQNQNWVTKRGQEQQEFSGNENSYIVNTIPKKEAEFKKFMDGIVSESIFKFASNPGAFMSLPSKDRRKTLFELVANIDNATVAQTDKKLLPVLPLLEEFTLEEVVGRDKKAIAGYTQELKELPIRIDEQSALIVERDYSETEKEIKGLEEKLLSLSEIGQESTEVYEKISTLRNSISDKESQLLAIEKAGKREAEEFNRKASEELASAKKDFTRAEENVKEEKSRLERFELSLSEEKAELKKQQEKYSAEKEREFDESSTICPVCGNNFDEDKKAALIGKFENEKEQNLLLINRRGASASERIKSISESIEKSKQNISDLEAELKKCGDRLDEIESNPQEKKVFDPGADYCDIEKEILEMNEQIDVLSESVKDADEMKRQNEEKKRAIREEISSRNKVLAGKQLVADAKKRVAELEEKQREVAQSKANTEKELYLLEEFDKAKVNMLSEKINEHFSVIKWKLFDRQINGGYRDICEPMINGISYSSTLNSGHKILAELDIIKALQEIYDCRVPVFLDNAERVNNYNLPEMGCQFVTMSVSDDESLKIMEG